MRKIKYLILRWLLDNVCENSSCRTCLLERHGRYECYIDKVMKQARKAWGIKEG